MCRLKVNVTFSTGERVYDIHKLSVPVGDTFTLSFSKRSHVIIHPCHGVIESQPCNHFSAVLKPLKPGVYNICIRHSFWYHTTLKLVVKPLHHPATALNLSASSPVSK